MDTLNEKPKTCPACNGDPGEVLPCPVIYRLDKEKAEKFACACCSGCRSRCEERLP